MELGFWRRLPRPIMALAPMANVTDAAFRRIIAKYGKPDVLWTEFVSADGLMSKGREALLVDLLYSESERPIVAQLFSGNPEKMFEAGKLVKELGFDGLDINMGCPDRSIEKSGAGAALIKNPQLARSLIRAAKEGSGLPVSIKTRLGYNKDILEEWLPKLLAEKPAAITIHARTRKEMSKVPARWERVRRAVEIRNTFFSSSSSFKEEVPSLPRLLPKGGQGGGGVMDSLGTPSQSPSSEEGEARTLILGNGDVKDIADAKAKARETGADGIMLGRAIFGNPYLFSNSQEFENRTVEEKLKVMVEHTKLFEKLLMHPPSLKLRRAGKNFAIMKKHFKAYVEGFPACAGRDGAKELRVKLMETESASEVEALVAEFFSGKDILV